MNAIIRWKSDGSLPGYIQIHGTKDNMLPMRFTKPTHVIAGAGHLLVLNRAEEVNTILQQVFLTVPAQ